MLWDGRGEIAECALPAVWLVSDPDRWAELRRAVPAVEQRPAIHVGPGPQGFRLLHGAGPTWPFTHWSGAGGLTCRPRDLDAAEIGRGIARETLAIEAVVDITAELLARRGLAPAWEIGGPLGSGGLLAIGAAIAAARLGRPVSQGGRHYGGVGPPPTIFGFVAQTFGVETKVK